MSPPEQLFDRPRYRRQRERSATTFPAHDFLHRIAEESVLERLDVIDRVFENSLIIGAASGSFSDHPKLKRCIYADMASQRLPENTSHRLLMDEEWLPFREASLDAIFGILTFHHVNDVVGALIQMHTALKPDGLMILVTAGARTLIELRSAFAMAEAELKGGVSPHISPFMDVRDAGALLQRAGFALPVADNEILNLSYEHFATLHRELRQAGEGNILNGRLRHSTTVALFQKTENIYKEHFSTNEGNLAGTAELLFLTGWKPHESQQKPSARGSGQILLTDVF